MNNLVEIWFLKKLNRKRIENYLSKIKPDKRAINRKNEIIKVSCVQRNIKPEKNVEGYIDMLHGFVKGAAESQSDLIIFPEYNFFDLFGIIPGFENINNYLTKLSKKPKNNKIKKSDDNTLITKVFNSIAVPVQNAVEQIMCSLAEKYKINIYTGSYIIKENKILYNGGSFISREGKILGTQKKLHFIDFEEELSFRRGTELSVIQTDIGKVVCPICMDATYFETFNLAKSLGCDIVILPIANSEEYNLYRALRGIWPRVTEAHVYGLKAALTGWFFGMHFTGRAGIFAPIGLTEKKNGVIAVSKGFEGDNLITAVINTDKLKSERETSQYFGDKNLKFEKDYFKKTYEGVR